MHWQVPVPQDELSEAKYGAERPLPLLRIPQKGTQLPQFGTIVLTVSQGKETRSLPNLIGYGLAAAKATLDEMGIPYSVYTVENSSYTPNTVFRTDPPEGTAIAASDDTVVKIYVTPEKTQTSGRKPVTKKD